MKTTIAIMVLIGAASGFAFYADQHHLAEQAQPPHQIHELVMAAAQQRDAPEPGHPASCNNYKQTAPDHRCNCLRARQQCHNLPPEPPPDVSMDKSCDTYCVTQHCKCIGHGCSS